MIYPTFMSQAPRGTYQPPPPPEAPPPPEQLQLGGGKASDRDCATRDRLQGQSDQQGKSVGNRHEQWAFRPENFLPSDSGYEKDPSRAAINLESTRRKKSIN